MIRRSVAVGVLVAAELVSACSVQPIEAEAPPPIAVTELITTTLVTQENPTVETTTTTTEAIDKLQARIDMAYGITADYMGRLACSVNTVEIETSSSLGENILGDPIKALVDRESDPRVIKILERAAEKDSDAKFLSLITHEMVHVCASFVEELDRPFTMPSGEKVFGSEGFTVIYDANSTPEINRDKFGAVEEGVAEYITEKLTGSPSSGTASYKASLELTKDVVAQTDYSVEEIGRMVAEGDLMSFVAAYYKTNSDKLTPSQFYDFMYMYADAYFGNG